MLFIPRPSQQNAIIAPVAENVRFASPACLPGLTLLICLTSPLSQFPQKQGWASLPSLLLRNTLPSPFGGGAGGSPCAIGREGGGNCPHRANNCARPGPHARTPFDARKITTETAIVAGMVRIQAVAISAATCQRTLFTRSDAPDPISAVLIM